jgi:UDP-2,4-diacetamido-2,4,6-trideoxy-beta-L-altropyranose hydrolase
VRADAGSGRGAGHVMRCLALMQAWRARGGAPVLAAVECPEALIGRVKSSCEATVERLRSAAESAADADETAALAMRLGAEWVVVDGYGFDAAYVERLQRSGVRVLFVDDLGQSGDMGGAVILNHNMHAVPALYPSCRSSELLLGLDYFLLRAEFASHRGWVREVPAKPRRIGVALGAADPGERTAGLIRALDDERFDAVDIAVIVGAANPRLAEIRAVAKAARVNVTVHADVGDMARFLASVDLLISSAGVTAWEAAFLSTPMVLGAAGRSEEAVARRLAEARACVYLGPFEQVSGEALAAQVHALACDQGARAALSATCKGLIDGLGPQRVIDAMLRVQGQDFPAAKEFA